MANPESECIFQVESDNEEEYKDFEEDGNGNEDDKDLNRVEEEDDGKDFNSADVSWPQSYRKSMDLYGSVASRSLTFLGSPTLSPSSGSFISASPKNRHTTKIITSLDKPLLSSEADNQQLQVHTSSDPSLHPLSTKKLSHHQKSFNIRKSSFSQAVINGVNLLCGVGLLSTPYAVKQGGWVGLSILFIFCVLSLYTGILLRYCLDSRPGLKTYPDIGEVAFGKTGRLVISIVLYVELYAACVEYLILEGDNLSSLFPNAYLRLGGYHLSSHYLFAVMVTLAVLPTVWLRDMSVLSYISAGGVLVSVLLVICLYWVGLVDKVGFETASTKTMNLSTLPVAIGLYGYCYAGHAVLPNIYMSMENQSQYPLVLLASFAICTLLYAGVAIMGYVMFGESIESQFTLNLPSNFLASKIAVWATVINPFTKYALTIAPVAESLEELMPSNQLGSQVYSFLIRTTLVMSTLLVALTIPFFGLVMSLIGSLLTMLVSLIFPCVCFLRIVKGDVTRFQVSFCALIIIVGLVSAVFGTYTSLYEIIEQFL
uniref:amino acid transporter AVT1C-like n=1 Tax=Erigeron canadensis TaxID=72917 RepID=UPI001CB93A74|nr:amino acid transporter AVT1C-like [Erigeron canadensis]